MRTYERKAFYYETDQMGIIHHSNYIRWFEEARIDMLDKIGLSYAEIEKKGIIIPVLTVSCEYKKLIKFGETVEINVILKSYKGVRFSFGYEIFEKETKELRCTGETTHCFLTKDYQPMNLKKTYPDIYETLMSEL